MKTQEIMQLVLSFLGGGLVVGILDWIRSIRAERAARAAEFLSEQLRLLYGPLYFFSSQNESICGVSGKMYDAYTIEYCNKKWAEEAHPSIEQEATAAIDVTNRYTSLMIENNNRMVVILQNNYGFIDPEDAVEFQRFITDSTRYNVEHCEQPKPPHRISEHLDPITFHRSDFSEQLKKRFLSKTQQLSELRRLSRSWLTWLTPSNWFTK